MYRYADGTPIRSLAQGVTVDGTYYPWPISQERLTSLGIYDDGVVEQRADDRFYTNGDPNSPKPLPELKETALAQIKQIRQTALDQFVRSAGVSQIYAENLEASKRYLDSDPTLMRDGRTPEQYLAAMSSKIGMDVATFVAYIMSENEAAAQKCAAIEEAYLEHAYLKMETITFEGIQTLVLDFQAALELIVNPPPTE